MRWSLDTLWINWADELVTWYPTSSSSCLKSEKTGALFKATNVALGAHLQLFCPNAICKTGPQTNRTHLWISYKILLVLDGHLIFERGRSPQFNILPTAWIFHKGDTANQTNHHDIETSKISFLSFFIRAILVLRHSLLPYSHDSCTWQKYH